MKGSIVFKKTRIMNMIENNQLIFRSKISKESKRFAWGRQTAFQDLLSGDISEYNHDAFMQKIFELDMKGLMNKGLNVVFGDEEE